MIVFITDTGSGLLSATLLYIKL